MKRRLTQLILPPLRLCPCIAWLRFLDFVLESIVIATRHDCHHLGSHGDVIGQGRKKGKGQGKILNWDLSPIFCLSRTAPGSVLTSTIFLTVQSSLSHQYRTSVSSSGSYGSRRLLRKENAKESGRDAVVHVYTHSSLTHPKTAILWPSRKKRKREKPRKDIG